MVAMLFSYRTSRAFLSQLWWCFSGLNALTLFSFLGIMCSDEPKQAICGTFLISIAVGAVVGLLLGLYVTYRADFSSVYSIVIPTYSIVLLEIFFVGSSAALAVLLSGRPDLRWFAFNTNLVCMTLALLIGMMQETRRLSLLRGKNRWREEIGKYLDFSIRLVDPALTTRVDQPTSMSTISMAAAIGVNIPLLFQIYGGGRDNAIFLAVPVMAVTFSYINFKTFGPGLTRIFLLRKIEKEQGFRFQNADYEKIQELRRGFFLAKWLMKDYRPPQMQVGSENIGLSKRHKNKKRR